jgi:hypothetical protein
MSRSIGIATDFGTKAGYMASMKGAMLTVCPDCTIVDLTHDIYPQNVIEAAHFIETCCEYFPPEFVFLIVVDPSVGTGRRMLCLQTCKGQFFIAPDNGILAGVVNRDGVNVIVSIENPTYWRVSDPSPVFHGRDIMGPVAAHLARGVEPVEFGPEIDPGSLVRLPGQPAPRVEDDGSVVGTVLFSDQFGNIVTNIDEAILDQAGIGLDTMLDISFSGKTINTESIPMPFRRTYADVAIDDYVCLINSERHFEIATNQENAAKLLLISGALDRVTIKSHDS